ncbi:MAG TPA: hypothetical protein VEU30_00685, partial [Thermoanaerobaculia bacterium]|nr:hypothetical protein [Thermoanaerobaculia bacterium]
MLGVFLGVLVLATVAPSSQAAFTSTHAGTTATMTGNSAGITGDILVFSASGGLMVHNRFEAGDPGYNSAFDFDTTLAGDQTLPVNGTATVNVTSGAAPDSFRFGPFSTFTAPADQLRSTFNLTATFTRKSLLINNST